MGDGDELRPRADQRDQRWRVDPLVGGQRRDVDFDARAVAEQLPGHDVAVVLERRDQDAVAGLEAVAPAVGDEVDRLGRAAGEDDLVGLPPMKRATVARAAS